MTHTIRFRPVVLGNLERPDFVFPLFESGDGNVYIREFEVSLEVPASLEQATMADLAGELQQHNPRLLPVHEATGETAGKAFRRMMEIIEAIQHGALAAEAR